MEIQSIEANRTHVFIFYILHFSINKNVATFRHLLQEPTDKQLNSSAVTVYNNPIQTLKFLPFIKGRPGYQVTMYKNLLQTPTLQLELEKKLELDELARARSSSVRTGSTFRTSPSQAYFCSS
jgi:hypothetical protein